MGKILHLSNNQIATVKNKTTLKKYVSCSVISDSTTQWTAGCQAPLSTEFSRQEYWSGLPCPPPGDVPDPGIKPRSPALQANSLSSEPAGTQHWHLSN